MKNTKLIVLASILLASFACSSEDEEGTATLDWQIQKESTREGLACGQGDIVRVTMGGVVSEFPCNAATGVTLPVEEGTYTTTVDLVGPDGGVRSTTTFDVEIDDDAVADMGTVLFLVE